LSDGARDRSTFDFGGQMPGQFFFSDKAIKAVIAARFVFEGVENLVTSVMSQ